MGTLVGIAGTSSAPSYDPQRLAEKQDKLFSILRQLGEVIVAYSGGTDSAYLAWAATQALGPAAVAITADSASMPESHKRDAEQFAADNEIRHEYIETHEFDNPAYVANNADRCFHCKDELFVRLEEVARMRGIRHIIYGVNKDDLGDYRPGQNAARLHSVKAPLVEAELTKGEIRELSRIAELQTWDRPASACLSSRIPYGTPVTPETVKTVEAGEESLKSLGFRQFRVRFHGELVRIEIAREEMERALTLHMAGTLAGIFKPLGFKYVTLDLEGYRQGSMNEVLNLKQ
jgi:pyridinium-3,5-biscarboxylic acid mononucleotide sulfurtransferase